MTGASKSRVRPSPNIWNTPELYELENCAADPHGRIAAAMRAMGAQVLKTGEEWRIHGVGVGGLLQPLGALEMGNSGTSTRLLMGLLASHAITAAFTGDASLSQRPMGRVIEPLSRIGASFTPSPGGTLPLMMTGAPVPVPIEYRLPVASAQVKSAVLLAGLNTAGVTTVIEPVATRDHSERMLRGFGAELEIEEVDGELLGAQPGSGRGLGAHGTSE